MKEFFLVLVLIFSSFSFAEQPVVGRRVGQSSTPATGAEAASKYFQKHENEDHLSSDDHFLALHFGKIMSGDAWEWGQKPVQRDAGNMSIGVTYRLEEVVKGVDLDIRVDYNEYQILGEKPSKLSFLPMVIFPEASSRFPLYFGAGAGVGVFFRQYPGQSALSADLQLVTGARFFNIYENAGFFVETGLKNHLHLLNTGQFNGTFLAAGSVFTF